MKITKNHIEAMKELLKMLENWIKERPSQSDSNEPISILALLAGSFLFRSFDHELGNLAPGTIINTHSEEQQSKEKDLIVITQSSLELIGIVTDIKALLNNHQNIEQQLNFIDTISKFQEPTLQIMKKYNLTFEQTAHSAAMATSYYIQQRDKNKIEDALKIAIYHYFTGSRTYPPDFA